MKLSELVSSFEICLTKLMKRSGKKTEQRRPAALDDLKAGAKKQVSRTALLWHTVTLELIASKQCQKSRYVGFLR